MVSRKLLVSDITAAVLQEPMSRPLNIACGLYLRIVLQEYYSGSLSRGEIPAIEGLLGLGLLVGLNPHLMFNLFSVLYSIVCGGHTADSF